MFFLASSSRAIFSRSHLTVHGVIMLSQAHASPLSATLFRDESIDDSFSFQADLGAVVKVATGAGDPVAARAAATTRHRGTVPSPLVALPQTVTAKKTRGSTETTGSSEISVETSAETTVETTVETIVGISVETSAETATEVTGAARTARKAMHHIISATTTLTKDLSEEAAGEEWVPEGGSSATKCEEAEAGGVPIGVGAVNRAGVEAKGVREGHVISQETVVRRGLNRAAVGNVSRRPDCPRIPARIRGT